MQKKKLKIVFAVVIGIITATIVLVAVLAPFIADWLYSQKPPIQFFDVTIECGDILNYYGAFLSFLATVILGCIAVYQTYNSQKKSDEINHLQLTIMQRELSLAEKQHEQEEFDAEIRQKPKFEIKIVGYSGNYHNVKLSVKNVSAYMVTEIHFIEFLVLKNDGEQLSSVEKYKMKHRSLAIGVEDIIQVETPNMYNLAEKRVWNDIEFVFKFSCEDDKGNRHYMCATLAVESTDKWNGDYWKVEKLA